MSKVNGHEEGGMSTLFNTITDADWRRELRVARATPNAVSQQLASTAKRFLESAAGEGVHE